MIHPDSRSSANGVCTRKATRWKRIVAAITVTDKAKLECVRCERNEMSAMKTMARANLSKTWVSLSNWKSVSTLGFPAMTPIEPLVISQPVPARKPAITGKGMKRISRPSSKYPMI